MVCIPLLERSLAQADVITASLFGFYLCFVNQAGGLAGYALVGKRAHRFFTVAGQVRVIASAVPQHFGVVSFNNAAYIFHAAVAHPHGVLVEDLVQRVTLVEMLLHKVEKFSGYVGFHRFTVWGVEPSDVSSSFLLLVAATVRLVFQLGGVASFVERELVCPLVLIKLLFVAGPFDKTVVDGLRQAI